MRKFKIDKKVSTRLATLSMAGMIFVTSIGISGCAKKEEKTNQEPTKSKKIVALENTNESIQKGIKYLFPTMNEDIIDNTSLIILLDEIAKENNNGKINTKLISNFKSNIDADNMMSDFNSFLDTLQYSMIEGKEVIVTSDLVLKSDSEILSNIESITDNIINGNESQIKTNFNLIYTLFVDEDKINYNGLTFEIRDLSFSGRAIAEAYAQTSAYYARNYITKKQYKRIDDRTNDQNNKAYIKTKLEILDNQMKEKSEVDVVELFNQKYNDISNLISGKVHLSEDTIKNLVNYINLEYLNSDKVSTKDKNKIIGEYDDQKVSDVLLAIDAINKYNLENQNSIILFSNFLVENYLNTETGKVDKVALDFTQFNSIMLSNTTPVGTTYSSLSVNPYFKNIYKYFTKQNFTHIQNDESINLVWQEISNGTNFINNEIILYTLNKLPQVKNMDSYLEKSESNLEESIQYIQNVIMGECKKVDIKEYIKVK